MSEAASDRRFPTGLEAAVMRGLSRDPGQRQSTVVEFAEQFAAGAAGSQTPQAPGLFGAFRKLMGGKREE